METENKLPKEFKELTTEQIKEIASLALSSITLFDSIASLAQSNPSPLSFNIKREIWDTDKSTGRNFEVIRVYLSGLGDTWCAIWEDDAPNFIDVTVVEDKEPQDVSNHVVIVKKLIEWGFV